MSTDELEWEQLGNLLGSRPLTDLAGVARSHGSRVALVGGSLRDALLGRPVDDLDLAVEHDLWGFLEAVEACRGRAATPIGDRFQDTHRLRWAGVQVDIARSLGSLEEDLSRRDFTINAMAVVLPTVGTVRESILDPHSGLDDLTARSVRETAPGVIAADPLRVLRGIRYEAMLPAFRMTPETETVIREQSSRLGGVAAERVSSEWARILEGDRWVESLHRACDFGAVELRLGPLDDLETVVAWGASADGVAAEAWSRRLERRGRWAALLRDLGRAGTLEAAADALVRERWPRRDVRHAARVAGWCDGIEDATPERLAEWAIDDCDACDVALELARRLRGGGRAGSPSPRLEELLGRAGENRWVDGERLHTMGLPPGPALGSLLRRIHVGQVLRRWPDRDAALEWARGQVESTLLAASAKGDK